MATLRAAAGSSRALRERSARLGHELDGVVHAGTSTSHCLQLVADFSQQVFPPRNVCVGFDTQR